MHTGNVKGVSEREEEKSSPEAIPDPAICSHVCEERSTGGVVLGYLQRKIASNNRRRVVISDASKGSSKRQPILIRRLSVGDGGKPREGRGTAYFAVKRTYATIKCPGVSSS